MTGYRRRYGMGRRFFFTVVTHRRRQFLTDDAARRCLRESWEIERQRRPFEVVALVLLPDHLHCIWKMPADDDDYSLRWSQIKHGFSSRYKQCGGLESAQSESRLKKREAGFWQRRFWEHRIRDEVDLQNHIDYIHYNPVRHGYVKRADEWPYLTIAKYGSSEYIERLMAGDVAEALSLPEEYE